MSPRRAALLEQAGINCEILKVDHEESPPSAEESPAEYALRAAEGKLRAAMGAAGVQDGVIICADTVVALEGGIFGKPADVADARRMLRALGGRTHQVHTGVAMGKPGGPPNGREASFVETTDVSFFPLTDEMIDAYIETGEPFDKAGAYGIQERAAVFVAEVRGCYANVVGLPVSGVAMRLREIFGINIADIWRRP
jgi:septum formation protein